MKVRLSLHARRLKSGGKGSPDPYAVVSYYTGDIRDSKVLGKTETMKNTSDPMWVRSIALNYDAGRPFQVKVSVFSRNKKQKEDTPVGSAVLFEVGAILSNKKKLVAKKVEGGGWLFVHAEKIPDSSPGKLSLDLQGLKLKNVDGVLGKSDPFFELSRRIDEPGGGGWARPVYRSAHAESDLNPNWKPCSVDLYRLCKGDPDRPIQVSVYSYNRGGNHSSMGSFVTTVHGLIGAKAPFVLRRDDKEFGTVAVVDARIRRDRSGSVAGSVHSVNSAYSQSTRASVRPSRRMSNHSSSGGAVGPTSSSSSSEKKFLLTLRGLDLRNVEALFGSGESDPFFVVSRRHDWDGVPGWKSVYKSRHIANDLNPLWETAAIGLDKLCDGDLDRPIQLSMYDHEDDGNHCPMGTVETTVNDLVGAVTPTALGPVNRVDRAKAFALVRLGQDFGSVVVGKAAVVAGYGQRRRSSMGATSHSMGGAGMDEYAAAAARRRNPSLASAPGEPKRSRAMARRSTISFSSQSSQNSDAPQTIAPAKRASIAAASHFTGGGGTMKRIELMLHARGLKNVAGIGKGASDPYAVVSLFTGDDLDNPVIMGKTEVIKNTTDPIWCQPIVILHQQGQQKNIEIAIYDRVDKSDDKPIGCAMVEMSSILGARTKMRAKRILNGGWVFVHAEELPEKSAGTLSLALCGSKLKNVEGVLGGKSDPFFEVCCRSYSGGKDAWRPVYRSEHVENDLNPEWKSCVISMDRLCGGDADRPIQISVYDFEKSGKHKSMGSIRTTVNEMIAAKCFAGAGAEKKSFTLKNIDGQNYGSLIMTKAHIEGNDGQAEDRASNRLGRFQSQPPAHSQSSAVAGAGATHVAPEPTAEAPQFETAQETSPTTSMGKRVSDESRHQEQPSKESWSYVSGPVYPIEHAKDKRSSVGTSDARQSSQAATPAGIVGLFTNFAKQLQLEDETLSKEDEECVRSREACKAIGTSVSEMIRNRRPSFR